MGLLQTLFAPREVWSAAVYSQAGPYRPGQAFASPDLLLNSRRLRRSAAQPYTQADPFPLVRDGALYVFLETMAHRQRGKISAYRSADLQTFEPLGIVLERPFHLSFPFVFEHDGQAYMVPESERANEVALYRFADFPRRLERVRQLVEGPFADSHLAQHGDRWYLFSTHGTTLHLFSAERLDANFKEHPLSPISTDARYGRSGGATLVLDGRLYRVAQDCSGRYGENCHLIEIVEMSATAYGERVAFSNIFDRRAGYDAGGAHHLSLAQFGGKAVILKDGRQADLFVNRFLGAALR